MKLIQDFEVKSILNKFHKIKIDTDMSLLSDNNLLTIKNLISCSKVINDIFLIQKNPDNIAYRDKIAESKNKDLMLFYNLMNGPYDEISNISCFHNYKKNDKAGFYPEDINKAEWDDFIQNYPEFKELFISPYTVIVRKNKLLNAIHYSDYYKKYLDKAKKFLNNIKDIIDNQHFKKYIQVVIKAFSNNDYDSAMIEWLKIKDTKLTALIGPYENYEDKFLGYKSSFSAFIGLLNFKNNEKINFIISNLETLQNRLPVPQHYINKKINSISYIDIIDLVYFSGDTRGPIPTTAFNLPNSEKLRSEYGCKKVIFYNILEMKFKHLMLPIADLILKNKDSQKVNFNSYFNYILFHEISHELGIGYKTDTDGIDKDLNYYLKDIYAVIEEIKADIMGIYSLIYLIKQGIIIDSNITSIYLTYLINLFRFIRYGKNNAHGLSSIIQLNYMIDSNAVFFEDINNIISLDYHKIEKSIENLLTIILTLQGEADYDKALNFLKIYSKKDDFLVKYNNLLKDLPFDIMPFFPIGGEK